MRKPLIGMTLAVLGICAAAFLLPVAAQDTSQGASSESSQDQSLAEAARKARAGKKNSPPAKRVWTNDNLPAVRNTPALATGESEGTTETSAGTTGGPAGQATAGAQSAAASASGEAQGAEKAASAEDDAKKKAEAEAEWRKKFAEAHAKLNSDQKELDIMQRELNLGLQQYYSDPNVAMREQNSRGDINDARQKIEDKKKAIEDDKQAISALEDELRRKGLPSSWASQP